MRKSIIPMMVLLISSICLKAQTNYLTTDDKNIYWQPNIRIDYSNYQCQSDSQCVRYNEKYGIKMCSSIGIRGVVDVPKRKGNIDIFYLAPVFCKNCSCLLIQDSTNLKVDQLMFDMAEACARGARKELIETQNKMHADNTYSMFLTTIRNKWDERMRSFFKTVTTEILIEKKDTAFTEWRKTVDQLLEQTEAFATKPEDCYRFVSGKPIEKNYAEAKTIAGDLRKKME